jgi:hypothetical protein
MATENHNEGFVELYDVTKKQAVAREPLAEIKFMPRAGERIFIPLSGPGDWDSYTVLTVEYFLGYDQSAGQASPSIVGGPGRVTLYVEPSK